MTFDGSILGIVKRQRERANHRIWLRPAEVALIDTLDFLGYTEREIARYVTEIRGAVARGERNPFAVAAVIFDPDTYTPEPEQSELPF